MITLVLESSTYEGSVALLDAAELLASRTVAMRGRDHEALMPSVAALLDACGKAPSDLKRIVCGAGPGAFTSLRISGAIAKGLALSTGADLFAVSSLALLVACVEPFRPGRYLAAVDAMRGEHYVQLHEIGADAELRVIGDLGIVASDQVEALARSMSADAIGPGRGGVAAIVPHARGSARITKMIASSGPANLAAWQPGYGRLAEAQVKWEAVHGRPLETN
ncbi:MAG: tRNA (adenosine(37)-N6)-threonylcarbamoyltransferase complex dimerization subunit type 1 TsaB [bacterium]